MQIGKQGKAPIKLKRATTFGQTLAMILRIGLLVALIIWLIWSQSNLIITRDYIFTSNKIPKTFVGYNIVHVSDIHNNNIGLVRAVSKNHPDIILVTGGFTDGNGEYKRSLKILDGLADIAPTYFVLGDGDTEYADKILNDINGPIYLADMSIDISAPEVDESAFIDKYIGSKIESQAKNGEEDAVNYIKYTKEKLASDSGKCIRLSGIDYNSDVATLVDKIYGLIGTDKEIFQISMTNQTSLFSTIQNADIDILFTGETHGRKDVVPGYTKGVYAESATTCFVSGGIGNLDGEPNRIFNYPEITCITLSDGTIKSENPLEKLLGYLIPDVKTKFDNDEGFKESTYIYDNGRETIE